LAVPVYSAGQVLGAADCNSWFLPVVAYKSSDTSRSSTTTPADDPNLTLPLAANAVYEVRVALMYACASTGVDLKMQFTVPASATGEYVHWYWSGATTFVGPGNSADPWTQLRGPYAAASGDMGFTGEGTIFTSASSGSLTLQWAQNTSSATALVLRKGSKMVAQRMG
jgi:hypothetical protein